MGGRRPKPLALALVESGGRTVRKRVRERAARAPQAIVGLPEPPTYLTDDQRALWVDLVAVSPGGLFCMVDAAAFETYVVLLDAQQRTLRLLNANGGADWYAKGLQEYKALAVMLRQWQSDFGFTPTARTKIQTTPEPPKGKDTRSADPLLRFLGNGA